MLVLQLDSIAVDAVMGALNLHAAICQQTASQIGQQVSNQIAPPAPPVEAVRTETTDAPTGDATSSDGS